MDVCCLIPNDFYSSYIVGRTLLFYEMIMSTLYLTNKHSWILIVLTLWKYSARTHMSLHWAHYSDYESTSLCLYSFTLCSNINFIVFGLTRSWIETTIYRTWCEYSNYYTTGELLFVITKRLISLEYIYIHFVYAKQKMHYLQINNMVIDIYIVTCSCHINYVLFIILFVITVWFYKFNLSV